MTAITTFGYRPHSETASQTLDRIERTVFASLDAGDLDGATLDQIELSIQQFEDEPDRPALLARRDELYARIQDAIAEAE